MLFNKVHELLKGELLYRKDHVGSGFYFVMNGNLESHVQSGENQEFKFSKTIDENSIHGLKKFYTEQRPDIAKVVSEKAVVIEFDTKRYFDIISKT
tara:strand:- start:276 stop:563 length:288 start_codon:yes stop_codon:yes gene_type:complete